MIQKPKGTKPLYVILYLLLSVALTASTWLLVGTDLLIRPQAIKYDGKNVTFVRKTPFGDIWANWTTEIRVSETSLECHSPLGRSVYQRIDGDTVSWELGAWADPCLSNGPPLVIVDSWQALIFGVLPIRPTHLVTVIDALPATPFAP